MVYNTWATTGKGFYYWNGSRWVGIDGGNDWKLRGNAGTVAGTDFLGTTDNVGLELFTNNSSRMRVEDDGQVSLGFNASPVNAGQQFNVGTGYVDGTAIGGYSADAGTGVYGQNIGTGMGIHGVNASGGTGVQGESFDGLGFSIYGLDGPVFSDNIFFGNEAFVGFTDDLVSNGIWAVNSNSSGTGILGANDDLSVYPANGTGVAGSGTKLGIFGYAGSGLISYANRGNAAGEFNLDSDSDPDTEGRHTGTRAMAKLAGFDNVNPDARTARDSYYGGYFLGGNMSRGTPSYAYAGMKYDVFGDGSSGTNYKIIGNGTNSTLIMDTSGTPRIMFSPEAPEILFQDFGMGRLSNGVARITIDPVLKNSLFVDSDHPLKVFVTLEGDCNGIYITDKSINGFTVKELQNGTSDVSFSWQIVANRADEKDASGAITSKHVGLRLPVGPGPLPVTKAKLKEKDKKYDLVKNSKNRNLSKKKRSEEEQSKVLKPLLNEKKVGKN